MLINWVKGVTKFILQDKKWNLLFAKLPNRMSTLQPEDLGAQIPHVKQKRDCRLS
jgi:hypothetical protein